MTDVVVVDQRFESEPAKTVLKYRLHLSPGPVEMDVPVSAHLLHAEFICGTEPLTGHWLLWFEVPLATKGNAHKMVFQSMGTGVNFPKCAKWMATGVRRFTHHAEPSEVWHLYEYPSGARVVEV